MFCDLLGNEANLVQRILENLDDAQQYWNLKQARLCASKQYMFLKALQQSTFSTKNNTQHKYLQYVLK